MQWMPFWKNFGFTGMLFEGEYRFTKKMVADFYEVDLSTIDSIYRNMPMI